MTRKVVQSLWFVLIASVMTSCNDKPEKAMPDRATTPNDSSIMTDLSAGLSEIPMDSDSPHIRLVKAEPNGKLSAILVGKKQSFEEIIGAMSKNLPKPVKFDDGIDSNQILEQFEIKMHDGSWSEFLSLIASEFDCTVDETDEAFLIRKK